MDFFSIAFSILRTLVLVVATVFCYDVIQCWIVYSRIHKRELASTAKQRSTERTFIPRAMTWKHSLLFMLQKWNYWIHFWRTVWYCLVGVHVWGKPTTERSVCEFLLSSPGIASHYKVRTYSEDSEEQDSEQISPKQQDQNKSSASRGQLDVIFDKRDFPFVLNDKDLCSLYIVMRLPAVPAAPTEPIGTGCKIIKFVFNGEDVETKYQLAILAQMFSSVCHGEIHSFFGRLYESRDNPALQEYPEIFLHGQYLNEVAADYPSFCYGIPRDYYHHVLDVNGKSPIDKHVDLVLLAPYSPIISFLWQARQVVHRCIREHNVDINPELFFLSTVLHAIDHYGSSRCVMYRYAESPTGSSAWFNALAAFFYLPSQELFSNHLKDKAHKNEFYGALYAGLSSIDQQLADHVTLSISY